VNNLLIYGGGILVFLFILSIISFSSIAIELEEDNVAGVNIDIPIELFNNVTGSVNTSSFTDCWITAEGVKCDVADITFNEISQGELDNSNFNVTADVLFGNKLGVGVSSLPANRVILFDAGTVDIPFELQSSDSGVAIELQDSGGNMFMGWKTTAGGGFFGPTSNFADQVNIRINETGRVTINDLLVLNDTTTKNLITDRVNITSTIDHEFYDSNGDLWYENRNSNKDFDLNLSDGGVMKTILRLYSSAPRIYAPLITLYPEAIGHSSSANLGVFRSSRSDYTRMIFDNVGSGDSLMSWQISSGTKWIAGVNGSGFNDFFIADSLTGYTPSFRIERTTDKVSFPKESVGQGQQVCWGASDDVCTRYSTGGWQEMKAEVGVLDYIFDGWDNVITDSDFFANNIIPNTGSSHSLGLSTSRWLKGWFDDVDVAGNLNVSGTIYNGFAPETLNVITGTLDLGGVGNLTLANGDRVEISESAGVPSMEVEINFTGLSSDPSVLLFWGRYEGSATHELEVLVLNFSNGQYVNIRDGIRDLQHTAGDIDYFKEWNYPTPKSDYVSSGVTSVLINHTDSGNAAHDLKIDKMRVTD